MDDTQLLDEVVRSLVSLGIACFAEHDQIPIRRIHPTARSGKHLEIDAVAIVGSSIIFIETTTQRTQNSQKIGNFIDHCNLIRRTELKKNDLLELFNIPEDVRGKIPSIVDYKYLYIGTSLELVEKKIEGNQFPQAGGKLHIVNYERWEYLKELAKSIGSYARRELYAALGFSPHRIESREPGTNALILPAFLQPNRSLGEDFPSANIYQMEIGVNSLLEIARVNRYRGLSENSDGYQRILHKEKLDQIAKYINGAPNRAFPNSLTLVLAPSCQIRQLNNGQRFHGCEMAEITIPVEYASVDVIDGQHRLFAFAHEDVSDDIRCNSVLAASAIHFTELTDEEERSRFAGRLFIEINSTHTKVSRAINQLVAYDVLGESNPEALAGKILKDCNAAKSEKPLGQLFETSPYLPSKFDAVNRLPVISVVQEMSAWFDPRILTNESYAENIQSSTGQDPAKLQDSDAIIDWGSRRMREFFSTVREIFGTDWGNSDSNLMSSNYFCALVRLCRSYVMEAGLTREEFRDDLDHIRQAIVEKYHTEQNADDVIVFSSQVSPEIPVKSDGKKAIYDFLKSFSHY